MKVIALKKFTSIRFGRTVKPGDGSDGSLDIPVKTAKQLLETHSVKLHPEEEAKLRQARADMLKKESKQDPKKKADK